MGSVNVARVFIPEEQAVVDASACIYHHGAAFIGAHHALVGKHAFLLDYQHAVAENIELMEVVKMGSRLDEQGLIHLKAVIGLYVNIHRNTHSRHAVVLQPIHKTLPVPRHSILNVLGQLWRLGHLSHGRNVGLILCAYKGYGQHYAQQYCRRGDQSYNTGIFLCTAVRLFFLLLFAGLFRPVGIYLIVELCPIVRPYRRIRRKNSIRRHLNIRSWFIVIQRRMQLFYRAEAPPWTNTHAIQQSLFLIFAQGYAHLTGQYKLILAKPIHGLGRLFAGKAIVNGGRQRVYVCP